LAEIILLSVMLFSISKLTSCFGIYFVDTLVLFDD